MGPDADQVWNGSASGIQCRICFDDCKPSDVISPCKVRLARREAFVASVYAHGWVGTIEHRHKWLHLRANDEAIDRATPGGRVVRIGKVVAIVRRVLWSLNDKVSPTWAACRKIKCASSREDCITHRFSLELPRIRAPKQGISTIDTRGIFVMRGGSLAVCRACDDQAMQLFE